MFKHLLVPLDGSHLAEAALPAVLFMAGTSGARVTLFHAIEQGAPQEIHGERHLTKAEEAERYLGDVAARTFPSEMKVERHVHGPSVENVAQSISGHAGELGCDLIVMCTHGRGGLRGFIFGRIAQQVAALGTTPILLIPPVATGVGGGFSCKRILTPLDGNPEHELGLKIATSLAKICEAELFLIMAVHTFSTLSGEEAATAKILPGATQALLDLAEQDAKAYLRRQLTALHAGGFTAAAEVGRGDPATVIIDTAEQTKADLIVLATHGKTGMDAFWSGSATPNVASRSAIPLLLAPVGHV
ncbi:UspA domain protein [Syntrophobacter sp. SbD1]|nr:UspA domain protein [Syntrophobacter sp. SbD1]